MIQETFHINSDERYEKVKSFIRTNMPTARFKCNPYKSPNGSWFFNISYEIEDINKLSIFLNELDKEDNKPIEKVKFIDKIKNYFKNER